MGQLKQQIGPMQKLKTHTRPNMMTATLNPANNHFIPRGNLIRVMPSFDGSTPTSSSSSSSSSKKKNRKPQHMSSFRGDKAFNTQ